MPPLAAADTQGTDVAPLEDDVEHQQLLQSQIADWLVHAAVDSRTFAKQPHKAGDDVIILKVSPSLSAEAMELCRLSI